MKKLLVTLAAVLVSVSTFAQGTILFDNRTLTGGDIRVFSDATRSAGAGTLGTVNAQLFLVSGQTFTPLSPATTFRTSAAASYFVNAVTVDGGAPAGTTVTLVMRAWTGSSYDAAVAGGGAWGQSDPFSLRLGGANPTTGEIIQTPDLAGNTGNPMQPFHLVPEPSTIALGVLGAVALLYRRRK